MLTWLKNCSLTIVLLILFAFSVGGQIHCGFVAYNQELLTKGDLPLSDIWTYLHAGHFIGSLGENWESEFLQMAVFVWLTVFLYQKGSAESNDPDKKRPDDAHFKHQYVSWRQKLYAHSLTLALLALFVASFLLHAYGSQDLINSQRLQAHLPPINYWQTFSETEFWFESFQNWQSEFFSIAVMGLLSIFLRQKGSPQSKRMHASHSHTGS